jgi:16S rRNA processing protein RimM
MNTEASKDTTASNGAEAEWDDLVLVGFVARTHGNKGQVILKSESDFADRRFQAGGRVFARIGNGPIERLEIAAARFQQGRPIVGFAGFSTISQAERLAGAELRIPAAEQEPLPEGAYYHHQLIGCEVVLAGGETLGRVNAVQGDGQATRLVVKSSRAEVLIPLAEEICRVDIAVKRIVVTPPEGLLEVNGEWR